MYHVETRGLKMKKIILLFVLFLLSFSFVSAKVVTKNSAKGWVPAYVINLGYGIGPDYNESGTCDDITGWEAGQKYIALTYTPGKIAQLSDHTGCFYYMWYHDSQGRLNIFFSIAKAFDVINGGVIADGATVRKYVDPTGINRNRRAHVILPWNPIEASKYCLEPNYYTDDELKVIIHNACESLKKNK